ncbi:MAG: sensor histidine kinase [Flammeovirgaceae bacterium]
MTSRSTVLYRFLITCLLILSQFAIPLFGQEKLSYKHYSVDNGLPHNITYKMFQDSKGYIWMGTDNGLARFDGTEWKNYNTTDGLTSPFPIEVTEAPDSSGLWIATWKGGINIIKEDSIYPLKVENGPVRLNGIAFLDTNRLAGWAYSQLWLFEKTASGEWSTTSIKTPYFASKTPISLKLFSAEMGDVSKYRPFFIGPFELQYAVNKEKQLLLYGNLPSVFAYRNDSTLTPLVSLPVADEQIYSFYEDKDCSVWLGSKGKIYHLDASNQWQVYATGLPQEAIYNLNIVANKYAYISTATSRYKNTKSYRYDLETGNLISLDKLLRLEKSSAYFFQDNEQNVWLTTDGDGVFCLYHPIFNQYTTSDGLPMNFIRTLETDKNGKVWIGSKAGVLWFEDGVFHELELTKYAPRKGLTIDDIVFSKYEEDKLWILGYTLDMIETEGGKFYWRDQVSGKSGMFDARGNALAIADNILRSNANIEQLESIAAVTKNKIRGVFEYQFERNSLLAVSRTYRSYEKQLFYLDAKQNLFVLDAAYNKQFVLANFTAKQINSIYIDFYENLWIGTEQGLYYITPYGSKYELRRIYTEADGLPSNQCRAIVMDQNKWLWVGTPNGLAYVDGERLGSFTSHSGLLSNDINCLTVDLDSNLWVGGSKGLSVVNVNEIQHALIISPPKLHFEKYWVNGKVQSFGDAEKKFDHDVVLRFAYKAITYVHPEKLVYEYRLNRGAWTSNNNLTLSFSSLKPGDYFLEIRARKHNSDWSAPLKLHFEIQPPWWRTTWAILGYIGLLALVFWVIMLAQRKRIQQKEAERIRINKIFSGLELKVLQAQMNPHFIFNALNAIQDFMLDNDELMANNYLSNFSKLMRMYLESSKTKYITIEQEVDLLRLYMDLEKLRFENKFSFALIVDASINRKQLKIPGMLIQPFIENSINHGLFYKEEEGNILVEFKRVDRKIHCIIDDDGIGREKAMQLRKKMNKPHKSRAMQIVDERLKAINSIDGVEISIKVIDKKDEQNQATGTRVEIQFPMLDKI